MANTPSSRCSAAYGAVSDEVFHQGGSALAHFARDPAGSRSSANSNLLSAICARTRSFRHRVLSQRADLRSIQPTKTKVLEGIAGLMLPPDGILYLGGAETVLGITGRFRAVAGRARGARPGRRATRWRAGGAAPVRARAAAGILAPASGSVRRRAEAGGVFQVVDQRFLALGRQQLEDSSGLRRCRLPTSRAAVRTAVPTP